MKLEIFEGPEKTVEKARLQLRKVNDDEIALEVVDAQGELVASLLAVRGGTGYNPTKEPGRGYVILYADDNLRKAGFSVTGNHVSTPLN